MPSKSQVIEKRTSRPYPKKPGMSLDTYLQQKDWSSEIRYRRLFESARDGILILNADTLRITDVNPFMTELLSYSRDEFLGKELWEIGLFSDKEASQEAFRELQ